MPSWPNVFKFGTFFKCCSEWIEGLVWVLVILFPCCLSIRLFCYIPIFCSTIVFFLSSICWYVFVHSPLLAGRIFFQCFGISFFVSSVWSFLGIFLIFWFISSSRIFACCYRFLINVSSRISHPDFRFHSIFFREH